VLGLFGNLDLVELVVIAGGAILVFGRSLPQVTMRGVTQVMKLRRAVTQMWRDAGIEDELRRVRWDLEREAREVKDVTTLDQVEPATPVPSVPDYTITERENLESEPGGTSSGLWLEDPSSEGPSEEEARAQQGHDEAGHKSDEKEVPQSPDDAEADTSREE
jgi:Sec-independent protein translocase protein TatA